MRHRLFLGCVVGLALTAGSSVPAAATGSLACTPHITKLRYRPQVTYSCTGASSPLTVLSLSVVRQSNGAPVGATSSASGSGAVINLASLASAARYSIRITLEDGLGDQYTGSSTWTTLPPPRHQKITVEYLTAIPPDALTDMLHRIDAANLVAVPSAARVIDVGTSPLTASGLEAALTGRQVALVVGGDENFAAPGSLGRALAWFAARGHGVVTAGQTHWEQSSVWAYDSAVGAGTSWDTKWDVFGDEAFTDPTRVSGGTLAASSVKRHFITNGLLTQFQVIGPGSGEPFPHFMIGSNVLASLKKPASGFFSSWPQALVTERQVGPTRLVDLGYRPWSSAIAGGGFNPSVSPGGALLARSLEWAANRIPPAHTRFTSKPSNPSAWATFGVSFAASDPDLDSPGALRFRYRLDRGRWRWAVGNGATFINLAKGRYHVIEVYAVDSGGNRDPHTARYRFLISSRARS